MTALQARAELDAIEEQLAKKLQLTYPDPREEIFQRFVWPSATSDGGEDIAQWREAYYRYLDALWPEHVVGTDYLHGPFAILVKDEHPGGPFLVAPDGGFATQDAAVEYLRDFVRSNPDPFIGGLKFEILALTSPQSFKVYCSW